MTEEAQPGRPAEHVIFETSPSTAKLDDALAKAQGEIPVAGKNKLNPHFKTRYADLEAVREACRPALSKYGIAATQWPVHSTDGRIHVVTRLAHAGEWIKADFSIPAGKADAQGYVAVVTYIKRCALAAAVGVVSSDEDNDGGDGAGAGGEKGDRLPESVLADHLAAIESAATRDDLKRAYLTAAKAAERDQISLEQIIAASKRRQSAFAPNGSSK